MGAGCPMSYEWFIGKMWLQRGTSSRTALMQYGGDYAGAQLTQLMSVHRLICYKHLIPDPCQLRDSESFAVVYVLDASREHGSRFYSRDSEMWAESSDCLGVAMARLDKYAALPPQVKPDDQPGQ